MDKPPCVEPGKSLNGCARALREQRIEGRLHPPAEWWNGWRIVKDRIIGPGGITFHRRQLEALWRLGGMRERQKRHGARESGITHAGSS